MESEGYIERATVVRHYKLEESASTFRKRVRVREYGASIYICTYASVHIVRLVRKGEKKSPTMQRVPVLLQLRCKCTRIFVVFRALYDDAQVRRGERRKVATREE